MRGYVSIDIETTGIDEKSQILQISAVYDDLKSPISELRTIDLPIKWDVMTHCEPYAMGMNADLLKKMMNKDFETFSPKSAGLSLIEFLTKCYHSENGFDGVNGIGDFYRKEKEGKTKKLVLAGKNVASFDIPKLKAFLKTETYIEEHFNNLIHYKTLDVGSLYYDVFKDNVSLSKINELTNRPSVSHNALDDALDVVYAVRHKLGVK